MKKWEYKRVCFYLTASEAELNKHGQEGWELIGMHKEADSKYEYLFKRETRWGG